MANPSILSVEITDAEGVTATSPIYLDIPPTVTVADLTTVAGEYLALLDAIIDGQITDAKFIITPAAGAFAGLKSAPVAGSNVESTGLFNFSQTGSKYKFGIDVPSIANSKIVGGRINLSDSDIAAWKGFIEGVHLTITVVSKFVLVLVALLDALRTFRKHRRALIKRSFEVGP